MVRAGWFFVCLFVLFLFFVCLFFVVVVAVVVFFVVFFLSALTRLGHERQDLLIPCDEMHVRTD